MTLKFTFQFSAEFFMTSQLTSVENCHFENSSKSKKLCFINEKTEFSFVNSFYCIVYLAIISIKMVISLCLA